MSKSLIIFFPLLVFLLFPAETYAIGGGLQLTVTAEVVDAPCTLRPGDEVVNIDFRNITNKELQLYQRTPSKEFILHLDNCDLSIGKSVNVRFTGVSAVEDSRFLSISASSIAKGVAIGFEYGGKLQPLNSSGTNIILSAGNNVLLFSTFVKLLWTETDKVGVGSFNSTANFMLSYE